MTADQRADKVLLGHISGVFGVKGWVKIWSDTAPAEGILDYREWWLGKGSDWRKVTLRAGQRQGKTIIAQLEGCDDRDAALALRGQRIAVDKRTLPTLPVGEYYWHQLQGLSVRTEAGDVVLGRVDHLIETGANDVLVVRADSDSVDQRERLIPWIPESVVKQVNLDDGVMVVDWDPEF